jgi:hypothetical protein
MGRPSILHARAKSIEGRWLKRIGGIVSDGERTLTSIVLDPSIPSEVYLRKKLGSDRYGVGLNAD